MEDNNTKAKLFQPHSSRAAIANGYHLFMDNFKSIFRSTWITSLVFAIVFSITLSHTIENIDAPKTITIARDTFFWIALMLGLSSGFALLRIHKDTEQIERPQKWYGRFFPKTWLNLLVLSIVATITFLAYSVPAAVLTVLAFHKLGTIAGAVAAVVLGAIGVLLLTPLLHTLMASMMKAEEKPSKCLHNVIPLFTSYGAAIRHLGMIFAYLFVAIIYILLFTIIIMMPVVILVLATQQSQAGVMIGDPAGMPTYVGWMKYVVFAIGGFVLIYALLSILFPLYFIFGSIETQEKERKEMIERMNAKTAQTYETLATL